ncbi:MAG: filamentous hemagglutinin N-terminal domain-containing protein [Xenococcaceae cyanobacterium MO_167.B27]|nr:filamentous hemagglutinin N-terminal domain-containing protein [Xenococcaceae cyanobacterium MO_167.B27]
MKLISSSILGLCCGTTLIAPASAQITTDGTTNTTVTPTDNGIQIDNGSRAGGNLFHSFEEFSIPNGSEAFFNNASDIVNILSRVTGGNISNIDGLIRANGAANLFLINPAGIIFGEGARLDIGGSFYGSTADSILFPDGIEFSATNPQRPILTINVPIGLGLGNNPGTIINQSVAEGVGLTVAPGQNLALIGGNIILEGGIISASDGNIELGSIAGNSVVDLELDNSSFELEYDDATNFSDITLNQGARIETTEADINLRGDEISLTDGSQIGSFLGGDINIEARELLINNGANITTATNGEGDGGDITIEGGDITINIERLNLQDGGQISSTSGIATSQENITQAGAAGNITINASESIEISGGSDNIVVPSLIAISSFTENSAGDINITTNSLSLFNIQDQGQIFSSDDFSLETNSVSVEEQEVRPEPILIPETLISSLHRVVAPREPLNSEIAQICHPRTTQAKSEFIITGRGGITPNTLEALQINPIAPDWVELPEAQNNSSEISSSSFSVPNPTPQIVEAIGWIRDESGEVILVADVNNVTGYDSMQKPRQCANN